MKNPVTFLWQHLDAKQTPKSMAVIGIFGEAVMIHRR